MEGVEKYRKGMEVSKGVEGVEVWRRNREYGVEGSIGERTRLRDGKHGRKGVEERGGGKRGL